MNSTQLTGRLGADPESTNSNPIGAKFRIATSEKFTDKSGEKREETTWHHCVTWGARAEKYVLPFLKKGDLIEVEGTYKNNNYEDKGGVKHYQMQLHVYKVKNLTSKAESEARDGGSPAPNNSDASDEVPF